MPRRNEIEIVIKSTNEATPALQTFGEQLDTLGEKITGVGTRLTTLMAPAAVALGGATVMALNFDTAMTNAGAVLGLTREQMENMRREVQALGTDSRYGATAAANAFYDIVSGVQDADAHMAILRESLRLATAGSADLTASTNAMINTMNSYGYGAEDAAIVSDILSRTVQMGKGTMDEFAAALPLATAMAASLDVGFNELAASAAFLTTQGATASAAITQIRAMMTSVMNPNETMKKALTELGYETGQAAVEALGLVGTYQQLVNTSVVAEEGLAKTVGSVEALNGALGLTKETFGDFQNAFDEGTAGATELAASIQETSTQASLDELRSQVEDLGITVGDILLPPIRQLATDLGPVLAGVKIWVQENPQLAQAIVGVTAALVVLGPIIMGIGALVSAATTIWGGLTVAYGAAKGALVLLTVAKTTFTTVLGAANVVATAAAIKMGAMATASFGAIAGIMAVVGPILAVAGAFAAVVAAARKAIEVMTIFNDGAKDAGSALDRAIERGADISIDDVYDQAFQSAAYAAGGGFVGDLFARLTYTNFAGAVIDNSQLAGRASGGPVTAGMPYIVGERQPELFVPRESGTIIPSLEGIGGTYNITINMPPMTGEPSVMEQAAMLADEVGRRLTMRGV